MDKKEKKPNKKRKWLWIGGAGLLILAIAVAAWLVVFYGNREATIDPATEPVLSVETPQKVSLAQGDEIVLDVMISTLGDARYPAMSMSISFDASRLEFLGIEEGNVFIHDNENSVGQNLPDWSCNVQNSNDTGRINIMYLDMTGGKYAFSKELLAESDNVLIRLKFRLRGSVRVNDVLDLIVEDAVFAASDETQSLAMTTGTLKTKNGKIVVGE